MPLTQGVRRALLTAPLQNLARKLFAPVLPDVTGLTIKDTLTNWTVGTTLTPSAQANATSDPGVATTATYARVPGLALVGRFQAINTFGGTAIGPMLCWATTQLGTTSAHFEGLFHNAGVVNFMHMGTGAFASVFETFTANTYYKITIVCRASGFWLIVDDSILTWYSNAPTSTPLYGQIISMGTGRYPPLVSYLKVAQLAAPFNSEYGLCTDYKFGIRSAGDTFSHTADTWIEYTVTSLPTGANNIDMHFRIQDATNYWQVRITSTGAITLNEVVAGTPTQRATAAGVVSAGHRVMIKCYGTNIRAYTNDVNRWSYASASNFSTATAGELDAIGDGVVTTITSAPRTLPASTQLVLNAV